MNTIVNVEADEILYRSCFAVERKGWKLITKSGKVRNFGNKYTKTKLLSMLKAKGKIEGDHFTLESYAIVEDLSHCLLIIKNTIQRLKRHGDVKLWLTASDKSNFRYSVATIEGPKGKGYKAGRPPRPVHYDAARDYLINVCGAVEIHGYEADDALAMYQTTKTIAAHIDKDINMVPGHHLNWVTGEKYYCSYGIGTLALNDKRKVVGRGKIFFYHQLLTGDATDNIPGVPGIGPVTAYKFLETCLTEVECRNVIDQVYKMKFGEGFESRLAEVADLLWMCRDKNETGRDYLGLRL